jgi:endonuclease/exonuclease/phosphatase family metal-dependent hydrolase
MVPTSASPVQVTLGTYNVKNWFAPEDANPELGKRPKPEQELSALAKNIGASGADIVTLQEVGTSESNVKQFFDTKLHGEFPYLAYKDTNDARGVHVVVASKYPITNVVSHTGETFPLGDGTGTTHFSRDLLRADIDVKGIPMTVYTTHAKSRRTYAPNDPAHPGGENPDNQRIGEGKAIASIVAREMKEYPNRLFVVTGDLNDGTEDKSVQAIMHPADGPQLFDTLQGQPESARRTWPADLSKAHGHGSEQFDHVLVPEAQKDRVLGEKIINIPQVSQVASDHLEIVTEFNLAP